MTECMRERESQVLIVLCVFIDEAVSAQLPAVICPKEPADTFFLCFVKFKQYKQNKNIEYLMNTCRTTLSSYVLKVIRIIGFGRVKIK